MKQILFSAILALAIGLFSSCEKNEDSEIAKLQGVWELKISDKLYEYTEITENSIKIYSCDTDPEFMAAKYKYAMDYTYDEKTKTISATLEGETDNIEVVKLTSSSLTIKNKQESQTLSRVKPQTDLAPESVIGMTLGVGSYNFQFTNSNTMKVIEQFSDIIPKEILGDATYSYTKTGKNTANLKIQFKQKYQLLYDTGFEEDVAGNLNLAFSIPSIGMVGSGNIQYNGMEYRIANGKWTPYEPSNKVIDYWTQDFILR